MADMKFFIEGDLAFQQFGRGSDNVMRAPGARSDRAEHRALQLLLEHMSEGQRRAYAKTGMFVVIGSGGGRWRITNAKSTCRGYHTFNVADEHGEYYCVIINDYRIGEFCPSDDTLLAQKLLLETDEKKFRQIANRFGVERVGRGPLWGYPPQAPKIPDHLQHLIKE